MDNLPAWGLWIIHGCRRVQSGARFAVGTPDRQATPSPAVAAPGTSASVGGTSAWRTCGNSVIVTQPPLPRPTLDDLGRVSLTGSSGCPRRSQFQGQ
jgi:hypothetical protein